MRVQTYSPELMARFGRINVNGTTYLHFQGGYSDWREFIRQCYTDDSPAGRYLKSAMRETHADRYDFAGVQGQSLSDALETGVYSAAYSAFQSAATSLHADRFLPGSQTPATAGGAWVIPLVLANNPLPARIRQRTKLPPKNLEISLTTHGATSAGGIAATMAALAKACWTYIEQGGAVQLTVHYVFALKGHERADYSGLIISVKVPLTNPASFASACSVQEYRAGAMMVRDALQAVNGAPVVPWDRPGLLRVTGSQTADAAVLQALSIK